MRRAVWAIVLAVGSVLGSAAGAEAQLAGRWAMEFGEWQAGEGRQVRIPGGNRGTLEIAVRGDSAFAKFTDEDPEPPELKGRVQGGRVTLAGTRVGMVNRNGEVSEIVLTIEMDIALAAGEMSGVMRLGSGGEEPVTRTLKGRPANQ